jgi:hypothetical protein
LLVVASIRGGNGAVQQGSFIVSNTAAFAHKVGSDAKEFAVTRFRTMGLVRSLMVACGALVVGALLVATVGVAPASADTTTVSNAGGLLAALHPAFTPGGPYYVHLGANIDTTSTPSIDVNTDVYLDLNGHTLTAGNLTADGITLHILDSATGGALIATGGDGLAGISANSGSEVDIDGGTVVATGGSDAAGIGSDATSDAGSIIITGGTITATGGDSGAGIGGGSGHGAGTVQISGGTVSATGGATAAGIGSGAFVDEADATPGTISIQGGTVTAVGGQDGAGIGGAGSGAAGDISIAAGSTVTASTAAADRAITPVIGGGPDALGFSSLDIAGDVTIPSGQLLIPSGATLTIESTGVLSGAGALDADPAVAPGSPETSGVEVANAGTITLASVGDNVDVTGNNYLVTFDSNAPDATPATSTVQVYAATLSGAGVSLPTPTRAGYSLHDWNSLASGQGTTLTGSSSLSDGTLFYAQWGIPKFVMFAGDGDFISGTSHTLTVLGESLSGAVLGDFTSQATFTSSIAGDQFTGSIITFGAAGHRIITATSTLDPTVTATLSVTVGVGALTSIALTSPDTSVMIGSTHAYSATGEDALENSLGAVAVDLTSSNASDTVLGNTVHFASLGERTITATNGTTTTSFVVTVSEGSFGSPTVVITGSHGYGKTLTADVTVASVPGAKLTYRWYRGSTLLSGTASTHKITGSNLGHTIKVTVSFSAPNYAATSVTSASVSIPKDSPGLSVSVPTSVKSSAIVTATVTLSAGASKVVPTGTVTLYVAGKSYKTFQVGLTTPRLWRVTLAFNAKGTYQIYASYGGSSAYASTKSSVKTLKVT